MLWTARRPWVLGRWQVRVAGWVLVFGSLWACAVGTVHRVRRGETLSAISARYGVSVEAIVRANRLKDPNCIEVGQELRIPKVKKARAGQAGVALASTGAFRQPPRRVIERWRREVDWPVTEGQVSSWFGPRGDRFHEGIDIHAPEGAPVLAAADGVVAFAGELRGYGLTVILAHRDGWATLYAHNERNLVREGQRVRRGQKIARLGRTGRTTGPNLHFEIRYDNVALDPYIVLPPARLAEPNKVSPWGG